MKLLAQLLLGFSVFLAIPLSVPGFASSELINGAGASFPYPLYVKWFSDYGKLHPDVQINYQSIGSGGGIRQLIDRTIDFGASDAPMTDEQLSAAKEPVLHLPMVLGAVVVIYNLPGLSGQLKLSASTLTGIFLGRIPRWNDPRIAKDNPSLRLPDEAILVTHRSDGSGTTNIFTDYLSRVSSDWSARVGHGTSVKWPTGLGGKGNEGVAGTVKQTPDSIGYVELGYAASNHLPVARIRNRAGKFVEATTGNVSAAVQGVSIPDDFRCSITDPTGPDAYPIAGFTYLLFWKKMADADKAGKLVDFLHWAIHQGQADAAPLYYAPLPKGLVERVERKISNLGVVGSIPTGPTS